MSERTRPPHRGRWTTACRWSSTAGWALRAEAKPASPTGRTRAQNAATWSHRTRPCRHVCARGIHRRQVSRIRGISTRSRAGDGAKRASSAMISRASTVSSTARSPTRRLVRRPDAIGAPLRATWIVRRRCAGCPIPARLPALCALSAEQWNAGEDWPRANCAPSSPGPARRRGAQAPDRQRMRGGHVELLKAALRGRNRPAGVAARTPPDRRAIRTARGTFQLLIRSAALLEGGSAGLPGYTSPSKRCAGDGRSTGSRGASSLRTRRRDAELASVGRPIMLRSADREPRRVAARIAAHGERDLADPWPERMI